ncbi:MAG: hypothetical protein DRO39_01290 [Thermoprotei archaeon]|nr:MAG: hypothetical protein DRO39_01290 [Thermoprotei archaeon]
MGRKLCLEFRGSLTRHFGDVVCVDVEDCPTLRDVVVRLAFERRAPVNHEYILFSAGDEYVGPDTDVCSIGSSRIAVHYVHPGG